MQAYQEGGVAGGNRISHMGSGITERKAGTADPKALPRQDQPAQGGGAKPGSLGGPGRGTEGIPARFLGPGLAPRQDPLDSPDMVGVGLPKSYEELDAYLQELLERF